MANSSFSWTGYLNYLGQPCRAFIFSSSVTYVICHSTARQRLQDLQRYNAYNADNRLPKIYRLIGPSKGDAGTTQIEEWVEMVIGTTSYIHARTRRRGDITSGEETVRPAARVVTASFIAPDLHRASSLWTTD
jgi:hypothetical protein